MWLHKRTVNNTITSAPALFGKETVANILDMLGGYLAFTEIATVSFRQFAEVASLRNSIILEYKSVCDFLVRSQRVRMEFAAHDTEQMRRLAQPTTPSSEADEFAWVYGPEREEAYRASP